MKAVIQRVAEASVTVEGKTVGAIGRGLLVLLGVSAEDTEDDLKLLTAKIPKYRIFPDDDGKMNVSLLDIGGELLVVSQFTLFGTWRKGNRPGFTAAASPEKGNALYEQFVADIRKQGIKTATGKFGAKMDVALVNEGPVTFVLDTKVT